MSREARGGYWRERASSFSRYYGRASSFSLRRAVSRFLDRRTRVLASLYEPDPDARVLDLGCGSGVHLRQLAPSCRQIVGVDYSAPMLALARRELAGLAKGNGSLLLADAQALPLKEAAFDAVISMGLLDYVPFPERVLAECRRVLKDGGTLVFSAPKSPSAFFFLRTRLGDRIKKGLFELPPISNVLARRDIDALLRSAGFAPRFVGSVWTTMWMVKAVKSGRRPA